MNFRDDLLPVLQEVASVPLGGSLYPHADQIIDLMREALLSEEPHQAATDKITMGLHAGDSPVHIADDALEAALDALKGDA